MKKLLILLLFINTFFTFFFSCASFATLIYPISKIMSLTIDSSINPATKNYLSTAITKAKEDRFQLIVIKLNTPGGLVSTTKDILTIFGQSEIPIAIWVTPQGSSATSAGAILSVGAHILFMSPGTNIGAATPVSAGEDLPSSDLRSKAINDLVALVLSLSKEHHRNGEAFAAMIKQAKSFPAEEALQNGLIDGLANNLEDLYKLMDQKIITVQGKKLKLQLSSFNSPPSPITVEEKEMDWGQGLFNILANPSLSTILMVIGALLLYLELQAPGGFIAGTIGTIFLILAGMGFQLLPFNFGSMGLVILSFFLFLLEAHIISFGLLTLAGLTALSFGLLFLFRTEDSFLDPPRTLIYSIIAGIGFFTFLMALYWFYDGKKNKKILRKKDDPQKMLGKIGVVFSELPPFQPYLEEPQSFYYQIKVAGEFWKAICPQLCQIDDVIIVVGQDKDRLVLRIEKKS